jgi:hypothetical protein
LLGFGRSGKLEEGRGEEGEGGGEERRGKGMNEGKGNQEIIEFTSEFILDQVTPHL